MAFKKGKPKTGGRKPGSQNKLTKTVKEHVLNVFNELQESEEYNLLKFAEKNPKEFYQIAAKLIPTEVDATVRDMTIKVVRE